MFPSDRWLLMGPDGEREFQLPASRFKVNMSASIARWLIGLHGGKGRDTRRIFGVRRRSRIRQRLWTGPLFYRPAVGAPASQRAQSVQSRAAERDDVAGSQEAYGGVVAGPSQAGSYAAVTPRDNLSTHH